MRERRGGRNGEWAEGTLNNIVFLSIPPFRLLLNSNLLFHVWERKNKEELRQRFKKLILNQN